MYPRCGRRNDWKTAREDSQKRTCTFTRGLQSCDQVNMKKKNTHALKTFCNQVNGTEISYDLVPTTITIACTVESTIMWDDYVGFNFYPGIKRQTNKSLQRTILCLQVNQKVWSSSLPL
jgi:hypothetical protein